MTTRPPFAERAPGEAGRRRNGERDGGARVVALVLAAGAGSRMGGTGKLLLPIHGRAMVCHAVMAAAASRASPVIVVVGHDAPAVAAAVRATLSGAPGASRVQIVENQAWRDGLAGSVRAGLGAVGPEVDGVVILLGDMPLVAAGHVDRLIDEFVADGCSRVCVPVHRGQRGNPVLWPARFFADLSNLTGDVGGRALMRRLVTDLHEVDMPDPGVLLDVDVPADLSGAAAGDPR